MLQSSIICLKCKGRLQQIFEFNLIAENAQQSEPSNIRGKCYLCKEEDQMKQSFKREGQRVLLKTKWQEVSRFF
jgi:hypothetical protein